MRAARASLGRRHGKHARPAARASRSPRHGADQIFFSRAPLLRAQFPFYPGELYHQFHNDFMGPPYGKAYNALQTSAFKGGAIGTTGCPDMDPKQII